MRKIKHFFNQNPIIILGIFCFLFVICALLFQYFTVAGREVGIIQGKVYSISQKPFSGYGIRVRTASFAKVKLATGEFIQVRCAEYCRLDQDLVITVYKPFFSDQLRYVYDRT